jgi:lysozyme
MLMMIPISSCKTDSDQKEKQTLDKETKSDKKIENKNSFVYGIDFSLFDDQLIKLLTNNKDSLDFIIFKATEGTMFTDPMFFQNWNISKDKGVIRGAYHFYTCEDDPIKQAKHFLQTISDIEITDLPPIVVFDDISMNKNNSQSINEIQTNLFIFIKAIQQKLNRKPIIKTNVSVGNTYLNNPIFAEYDLWIDDYTVNSQPELPELWKSKGWTFWSKSDTQRIDYIIENHDVFNGTMSELKTFLETNH